MKDQHDSFALAVTRWADQHRVAGIYFCQLVAEAFGTKELTKNQSYRNGELAERLLMVSGNSLKGTLARKLTGIKGGETAEKSVAVDLYYLAKVDKEFGSVVTFVEDRLNKKHYKSNQNLKFVCNQIALEELWFDKNTNKYKKFGSSVIWSALVQDHVEMGGVEVLTDDNTAKPAISDIATATAQQVSSVALKQSYQFRIKSPFKGSILALQMVRNKIYLLRCAVDRVCVQTSAGVEYIPKPTSDPRTGWYCEDEDDNKFTFFFIIGRDGCQAAIQQFSESIFRRQAIDTDDLNEFATELSREPSNFKVFRKQIDFYRSMK